jgi:hypothetical protein
MDYETSSIREDAVGEREGPGCMNLGGAFLSTGSIAWCGRLSYNGCDNNVSRITDNVLRRFASTEPRAESR